ncbi:hypothetical protein [Orrella sp. 11846]|uniref:hypothetical protein n=1 Tax=Orrella sp. 11846 TaxID=3409913 RepID=UPI003B5A78A2
MSKNISHLRDELFDAIALLKEGKIDVNQAKAISDLSQNIINTAKVEVDYIRAAGGTSHSEFIEAIPDNVLPPGVLGIKEHKMLK